MRFCLAMDHLCLSKFNLLPDEEDGNGSKQQAHFEEFESRRVRMSDSPLGKSENRRVRESKSSRSAQEGTLKGYNGDSV